MQSCLRLRPRHRLRKLSEHRWTAYISTGTDHCCLWSDFLLGTELARCVAQRLARPCGALCVPMASCHRHALPSITSQLTSSVVSTCLRCMVRMAGLVNDTRGQIDRWRLACGTACQRGATLCTITNLVPSLAALEALHALKKMRKARHRRGRVTKAPRLWWCRSAPAPALTTRLSRGTPDSYGHQCTPVFERTLVSQNRAVTRVSLCDRPLPRGAPNRLQGPAAPFTF